MNNFHKQRENKKAIECYRRTRRPESFEHRVSQNNVNRIRRVLAGYLDEPQAGRARCRSINSSNVIGFENSFQTRRLGLPSSGLRTTRERFRKELETIFQNDGFCARRIRPPRPKPSTAGERDPSKRHGRKFIFVLSVRCWYARIPGSVQRVPTCTPPGRVRVRLDQG